jgi:type 1 fimbria pilin
MKFALLASKLALVALLIAAICSSAADAPTVTIKGYVLDSACAFTKGLSKPVSKQCAICCANAGSPLVILADDGTK